jgi:PAS domain S-box-containing protein
MIAKIFDKLKALNPWHFLWIGVLMAEIFTLIMSSVASLLLWGFIPNKILVIGFIDSFVVSIIVISILIYLMKESLELTELNELLQNQYSELKRTEKALIESEDKFRSLAERSLVGVYLIQDGIFKYCNPRLSDIFGYTHEEVINRMGPKDLVLPEDWPIVEENIRKRIDAEADSIHYEFRGITKNKEIIFVEVYGTRTMYQSQPAVIGTLLDISKKKILEEQLIKAKEDWEDSFHTINDAITIHDKDFNIIRANKAAEEMMGLSWLSISRQKCYESYHGTDCPPEGCPSCKTLETGVPSITEIYEPHINKHIEIKALPRLDDDNQLIGLIHVVRDIDDRKKAEEKAIKANLLTSEILKRSPFGIYVVNKEGKIEYVNPAMLEISGDDEEDFLNLNVFELPTYKEPGITDSIRSTLNGKPFFIGPINYTSYFGRKNTIRYFTGIPFGEDKALIFVEDVSELVKADEERRLLQTELLQVQKIESIGRLTGGIAHDFNNILSSVIGFSELALRKIREGKDASEYIEIIMESGEKAAALTRQLLAFSRKQILERKVINLNPIVEGMGKMLTMIISEDVELNFKTQIPLKNIYADPGQVEQILLNLSVNAKDAMPQGGSLTIETSNEVLDKEFARVHEGAVPGDYVLLRFTDKGQGMSQDVMDRIFEPFFTTKEEGKGTGLGMSTVYGIVKQHGGYIRIESSPGKGTNVFVYFPAVEMEEEEDSRSKENFTMSSGNETVLVVEDDHSIQKMILSILQPLGYDILSAHGGTEALDLNKITDKKIDLLITDVIMPGINGIELSRRLKAKRPGLKVIFMTGYADNDLVEQIKAGDASNLIVKPLKPNILSNKVREVLDNNA